VYKEKEGMLIGALNNLNQQVTRKKYPPVTDSKIIKQI